MPLPRLIQNASLGIFNHGNLNDLTAKTKFSKEFCCTSAFPLMFRNAEHTNVTHEPCLNINQKKAIKKIFQLKIFSNDCFLPLLTQNT
jgi:hypothetical protein